MSLAYNKGRGVRYDEGEVITQGCALWPCVVHLLPWSVNDAGSRNDIAKTSHGGRDGQTIKSTLVCVLISVPRYHEQQTCSKCDIDIVTWQFPQCTQCFLLVTAQACDFSREQLCLHCYLRWPQHTRCILAGHYRMTNRTSTHNYEVVYGTGAVLILRYIAIHEQASAIVQSCRSHLLDCSQLDLLLNPTL